MAGEEQRKSQPRYNLRKRVKLSQEEDLEVQREYARSLGNDGFVVDHIVEHKYDENGKLLYLVKWHGFDNDHNTLEDEDHLSSAQQSLLDYHTALGYVPGFKESMRSNKTYEQPGSVYNDETRPPRSNGGTRGNEETSPSNHETPQRQPSQRQKRQDCSTAETYPTFIDISQTNDLEALGQWRCENWYMPEERRCPRHNDA